LLRQYFVHIIVFVILILVLLKGGASGAVDETDFTSIWEEVEDHPRVSLPFPAGKIAIETV